MIGERLIELRNKNNMTQEEFAEYMIVTRQSVSKWENGKAYPDVEKMIKIAELYNVSLDYLIRGEEAEPVPDQQIDIQKTEEINEAGTKSVGLKVCVGVAAVFCLISLAFIIMFLVQNPWFHSDIKEQSVKVDDVYSQLSMAQVSYETEKGDTVTEVVLLDLENVGQGDSISIYANGNGNLFVDYGAGLLTAVIVFFVINLGAAILLVKEISRL